MTFSTTSPPLVRALTERNYDSATAVQTAVTADAAAGRDLLVSAQTGSGKTVAYGLAIAKDLLGDSERFERAAAPLALIVAPTRELALQVHRELAWLYQYADARVVSCVGGMDPRAEQRQLAAGAHIVVGTPGRLCDHLRRGRLDVSQLKAVVLDEADEMLDLGFREDMEFILKTTPATRRTLLFSATLPRGIVAIAKTYQQQAFRVEVAGDEGGHADIEYRAIRIAAADVEHAVVNVLRFFESPGALVFCNTRNAVRHLQATLSERGFSVVALSGELTQNERTQALQSLRDGRARVCVATDVAARGIDLPNLDLVIHADLPNDRGSDAASLRPYRPGRPQGRQRAAGAAGAQAARGIAAQSRRHRRGLGHRADVGRNPQARPGADAARIRCSRKRTPRRIWCWRRPCWPSGRPRISRQRWRGSTARGCRRRKTFSMPATAPAGPATSAAGKEARGRHAATIARPRRAESPVNHRRVTAAWRRAACGFAPPSAARRTPKRAGCCR